MRAELRWLTDPTVFQVNRMDAHSDHACFASREELEQGETSLRQSLDGIWRFCWSPKPSSRPADFWREGADLANFGTIRVPGHMELQGHGRIQYINTLYPWDGHSELRPPEIDWEDAPVGSYVREFDLSPGLLGKRVTVSFQGVEQAFYLWLNGSFVGYAEDSFTPSEFDLTPWIRETGNRLCVEVHKRCSASWIEDQDFFRFSGIFRSVYLEARPKLHLADMWLQAGLEEDNSTGTLSPRLLLEGEYGEVRCRIDAPDGKTLFDGALELHPEGRYLRGRTLRLPDIQAWGHGHPALYRVTLTLLRKDGTISEMIPWDTGFRRVEIRDGVILLNGERLVINGVNRHEWNPETGRAIGLKDMEAAVETFKRNNINAVRTCHYPNQTAWYRLCDGHGIYVMDETNLESHGSWQKRGRVEPDWNVPGSLPQWRACVVDRARSMLERDKNHVSVLFWSCGNESYAGEDILAMAELFRREDPSRIVHYEGVFHCREFDRISDVESRMYAPPEDIRAYLENSPKKPFLLCEYMHDMGNSLGGMESYIRLGEEFPQYQGGFIWDYMDQALWRTDCRGRRVLGYGGDFGERQSDYAFSANGIVFADGTEKPAMQEVRYWYASPAQRESWDQASRRAMERPVPALPVPREGGPLRITRGDGALGVRGDRFEVLFSYSEGGPVSLVSGGGEWLWRAPRPAYWRAPTENDRGNRFAENSGIWDAADVWQRCEEIRILSESPESVSIRFAYTSPVLPGLRTEVDYTLDRAGVLQTDVRYQGAKDRPELPLLGLRFAVPLPLEAVRWLGLSGETYPDRKRGAAFGWHREVPGIPAYLVPQECGCHVDTRAVILERPGGGSLALEMADRPLAFSAIPYTPRQLEQAAHREELPDPVRTVVTVCGAMRGVGGIDSWGSDVEPAWRVSGEEDINFSFRFRLGV